MIRVREAQEKDVTSISEIFQATYGDDYPYQQFFDESWLKRSVYNNEVAMIVAEDEETGQVLGTASVMCDMGATSDLLGEFGRLAVHPDGRRKGLGRKLMEARLEHSDKRLHVAFMEARTTHPFSQRIAAKHGFAAVGFLPMKHKLAVRENFALMVRYFGDALQLRRNHPRIIPEAYTLAFQSLENIGLSPDVIVDDSSPAYSWEEGLELETLSDGSTTPLLRMERGRVRNREIFGPMRLQYGFFRMHAKHAEYVIAREDNRIVGALGFIRHDFENIVRIVELIAPTDQAIRFLLEKLERLSRTEWGARYIEVDVNAHSPRMQRTLLELGFMPVAYVPAMVFDEVERLDVIRMVRLNGEMEFGEFELLESVQKIANPILDLFQKRQVIPRIAAVVDDVALFEGLDKEQMTRLASSCKVVRYAKDQVLFQQGEPSKDMLLVLSGEVSIQMGEPAVEIGKVGRGETLGELSLLTNNLRTATAVVVHSSELEAASLTYDNLIELTRLRPDIAVTIYRNLATGLGEKLKRSNIELVDLKHKR
jgi:GNAT superfamily N-acetyltransferase